jgi:hypothetical protein
MLNEIQLTNTKNPLFHAFCTFEVKDGQILVRVESVKYNPDTVENKPLWSDTWGLPAFSTWFTYMQTQGWVAVQ